MASGKRKRKATQQARKQRLPQTGAFRHPDGDRRRRGEGMTYREVMAIKRVIHGLGTEGESQEEE